MTRTPEAQAAYEAWVTADQDWMAELEKAFGTDACNRRFQADQSEHPQACRDAAANWSRLGTIARKLLGWDKPPEVEMY